MTRNDQIDWGNQSGSSGQENENEQSRNQNQQTGQSNEQWKQDGQGNVGTGGQQSDGQQSNQHGRGGDNSGLGNDYSSDPDADDLPSGTENGRDEGSADGSD